MLVAHDLEGETFRAIGNRLGLSPATVLQRVKEARGKLLRQLPGHDSGDKP
jgi:DNA-directed RNA polymerase specialized sigma24 family protein